MQATAGQDAGNGHVEVEMWGPRDDLIIPWDDFIKVERVGGLLFPGTGIIHVTSPSLPSLPDSVPADA
jgi:hypothetical protein